MAVSKTGMEGQLADALSTIQVAWSNTFALLPETSQI